MPEILEVKEKHEDELLELENCVSVGVGKKEIGGMETDEDAIIVGVEEKVPEEELDDDQIVPPEIEGFRSDVQEFGPITAPPNTEHEEMSKKGGKKSRKNKWRPVPEGVSCGHKDITAGTSSFILIDEEGNEYPSSNCHVYAASNKGEKGDACLQPGLHDGGELPDDKCGELENYVKVEDGVTVDLAWIKPTVEFENKLLGLGTPEGPARKVEVGDTLGAKTGRTTQVTRGKVKQAHASVRVRYPDPVGIVTLKDQIITEKMLSPGDSGSPGTYEDGGKERPAALGFAGSSRISVFNRIENVMEESGMRVKTEGSEGPPSPPNVATAILKLEKEEKGNGRIKVGVKDKDTGEWIEDARVAIDGPVQRAKKTDKDGRAIFKKVPAPAKYEVTASKKGYKSDSTTITKDDWTGTPGKK